ncbi:hypothetical protein D3C72_2142430 [compost metagenome]
MLVFINKFPPFDASYHKKGSPPVTIKLEIVAFSLEQNSWIPSPEGFAGLFIVTFTATRDSLSHPETV